MRNLAVIMATVGFMASANACRPRPEVERASAGPDAQAMTLLEVDRRLGAVAATKTMPDGLASMLAPDAMAPAPGVGFLEGRDAILAALARDTLNATSRANWVPVRAGVSSDGSHGVTIGLLTVTRASGAAQEYKYLAYWVRVADGWRAQVWRRTPRAAGATSTTNEAPWLSQAGGAAPRALSGAALESARRELMAMETIFSDSAKRIGIGPAFEALGAPDAMHLGGPQSPDLIRGNVAIARSVQGDGPVGASPVTWSAERALIAPSGDLGVTLGFIVPNGAGTNGNPPQRFPFFTVWRRGPAGWKFIAE